MSVRVSYVGDDRDRTLLFAVRLEDSLESVLRLFRRRSEDDRPPSIAFGRLAGQTEYGRAFLDAADGLAATFREDAADPADVVGDHADRRPVQAAVGMAMTHYDRLEDVVDAPIVGTTSVEHLEDAVEAMDIDLSDSDVAYLEEPYEPVAVSGHE